MDHTRFNLYSVCAWLIKTAISFVRKRPFFSSSLAIHALALYLLYSYGSYTLDVELHQKAGIDVAQSLQKAQQSDLQKRIEDMEKIKRLLEKSANRSYEDFPPDNTNELGSENSSTPTSPAELLTKARKTSEAIKTIEKNIKADDLAKLLKIPRDEALKKVEEKIATEQTKSKKREQDDVQAIKQMEAEARSALIERKKELGAKAAGTKIELSQTSHQGNEDQNATGGKSESGKASDANGYGTKNGSHGGDDGNFARTDLINDSAANSYSSAYEMEEFLAASSYGMGNENKFFDVSRGHIPAVNGNERKQAGRIIGSGGSFAERVYLNSWYVIGPFNGNSNAALYNNPSYPPEQLVDLDAVYFGKDERILKWQYVASGEYPFVPPDRAEDAVYYGYSEVALERAQDLWMWCGADDDMQVWLNEHLVWAGGNIAKQNFFDTIYPGTNNYRKNWNLTEGKRLVHFQQGKNKLLFKLSNGPNPSGIFASIILTQ